MPGCRTRTAIICQWVAGRVAAVALTLAAGQTLATELDTIGVTLLQQVDPTLKGNGVRVAQVEAPIGGGGTFGSPYAFEVSPASLSVPTSLFTYLSLLGSTNNYPNSIGAESGHAEAVGGHYYASVFAVATNVSHVDNYEANYYYDNIIHLHVAPITPDQVVNQSFIFGSESPTTDQDYDNYAATNNIVFASGAGTNGGAIQSAATCYNGLGVGVSDVSNPPFGPTTDLRSKPDISAPGGVASYATPYVSGVAAILTQAAARGDGGGNTAAAGDPRTIKALLMNGAVKPTGWSNGPYTLDTRYGVGVLNAFNSWKQLTGGKHPAIQYTTNAVGSPHPPGTNTSNVPVLAGWDFGTITNRLISGSTYWDRINHYYFDLTTTNGNLFSATATLVWNRQASKSTINNLNLYLYNTANSNLVASSTNPVDNVAHIFVPTLPRGRYDLQVEKNPTSQVTTNETYALAFEFFNVQLNYRVTNGIATFSWPIYPAGFNLVSTSDISQPTSWTPVGATVTVSGNSNLVTMSVGPGNQFFRLRRP